MCVSGIRLAETSLGAAAALLALFFSCTPTLFDFFFLFSLPTLGADTTPATGDRASAANSIVISSLIRGHGTYNVTRGYPKMLVVVLVGDQMSTFLLPVPLVCTITSCIFPTGRDARAGRGWKEVATGDFSVTRSVLFTWTPEAGLRERPGVYTRTAT